MPYAETSPRPSSVKLHARDRGALKYLHHKATGQEGMVRLRFEAPDSRGVFMPQNGEGEIKGSIFM